MLKGHPRGLYVAFFANMGERFGFYTMMAILVLFLQAKYGLSGENAGYIYSGFYFSIYALALVGGLIADKLKNFKGTIQIGIITMLGGYVLMSVSMFGLYGSIAALAVIALGNGLFKGNLQAVVGQLYDNPKYSSKRDSAFTVFYMGINIGAFFAPSAATGIRNWALSQQGFGPNNDLPSLCHQYLNGTLTSMEQFTSKANEVSLSPVIDLKAFATQYIDAFATGYHYAFGVAAVAMLVSLIIYVLFKRILPSVQKDGSGVEGAEVVQLSKKEEKQRFVALGLVFAVVIFFWMSFHQNGLSLTMFARDYTVTQVSAFTNMFFEIGAFLTVIAAIFGLVFLVGAARRSNKRNALIGLVLLAGGGFCAYLTHMSFGDANDIDPEIFQHFNPIFIVFLTPVVLGFFAWLKKKNIEPSTPKKIGIGMILAACGFVVMLVASLGLTAQADLGGQPSPDRVSSYWLINTYFILTIAELFLSPIGISFVSKVSPPRFQGIMQGCWLGATALGNQLLFVGSVMYSRFEVWQVWLVFIICCSLAAAFIFSIMKKLERATSS